MAGQSTVTEPQAVPARYAPHEGKAAQDLRNKALPPLDNRAAGERSVK